ncbi:hypothetical protein DOY81_011306, partial [Sarcophaga bullata]
IIKTIIKIIQIKLHQIVMEILNCSFTKNSFKEQIFTRILNILSRICLKENGESVRTRCIGFCGTKAPSSKNYKEATTPMSTRNFPPSFWNSNYVHPVTATTHPQMSDLYSSDGGYATDPWVPHAAAHYGTYAHAAHAHAAHAHAYHHNMAQYGSLLRLPQQYGHSSRLHHDQQTAHALESAAAYSSYPTMAGLEAQVQESSKDLYWF